MLQISRIDARVTPVHTRIPFRYGIATMTEAPHVVLQLTLVRADGTSADGFSSEHLPPKWFTKDPNTSFAEEITDMVRVIERACAFATGLQAETAFSIWQELEELQHAWARKEEIPGLLASLGVALVERALIDANCRLIDAPFATALKTSELGFSPEAVHPELSGVAWANYFNETPDRIAIRHTVGLSDPLRETDVTDAPSDKLPVDLETILRVYGVKALKIKTAGNIRADIQRLMKIKALTDALGITPIMTIDANESFTSGADFVTWVQEVLADDEVGEWIRENLEVFEQPFHRSVALSDEVAQALETLGPWPAVVIDESDAEATTVREAMDLGYAGGTYKGCKGVFRGLANAVLIRHRSEFMGQATALTAEDLSTIPPLTVPQDLVVAAVMGLQHIERNGHHYFGRLAPLDPDLSEKVLESHPDLYERHSDGVVRLRVNDGYLALDSILRAPFGLDPMLDISDLTLLSTQAAVSGTTQ